MTTEHETFIPTSEFLSEDDMYAVKLPAQSRFPGCWLAYSISSRGSWIAAAVIIRGDLTEDDLYAINPFEDKAKIQNAIQELNLEVVDKLEPVEGDMYDPVMFTLGPSQTYIDWWTDNEDDCVQGVYLGTDPEAYTYGYFDSIGFDPENGEYEDEDDDWDDDDDYYDESVKGKRVPRVFKESIESRGFVPTEFLTDGGGTFAVQFPEGSKFAGDWLVYSTDCGGFGEWVVEAFVTGSINQEQLERCNPFCSKEELEEDGFDVIYKFPRFQGDEEPIVLTIDKAHDEYYVDCEMEPGTCEGPHGFYFGKGLQSFINSTCIPGDDDDDDYDDDDDF